MEKGARAVDGDGLEAAEVLTGRLCEQLNLARDRVRPLTLGEVAYDIVEGALHNEAALRTCVGAVQMTSVSDGGAVCADARADGTTSAGYVPCR